MAKSTAAFMGILVIFVALLILANLLGHKNKTTSAKVVAPGATAKTSALAAYPDPTCGIQLSYPDNLNILEGPTGSVIFTGQSNPQNVIIVTCQKNIPRPIISADKTEQLLSGSVSATLYHDASLKDGMPIDKLIFTNPINGLDIFISGYGADFQKIISNIQTIR